MHNTFSRAANGYLARSPRRLALSPAEIGDFCDAQALNRMRKYGCSLAVGGPAASSRLGFTVFQPSTKESAKMRQPKMLFSVMLLLLAIVVVSSSQLVSGSPPGQEGAEDTPEPPGEGLTEEQAAALEAAGRLAGIQFPALDEVRRGCPACHTLVDPETGRYTLPFEAHERAEARGNEHPAVSPSGVSITPTDDVSVTVCLECHAPGTGDRAARGVIAPLSLRDIVHPAHMSSPWFKFHYGGSCFTCHNVDGEGEWELLTEQVDVNEKGVPNPEFLPIPGAQPIGP